MASFKKPGGGVRNGARTQEECLFRCSNLATPVELIEDFKVEFSKYLDYYKNLHDCP